MAWLEKKKSGVFHVVFRVGDERYRRSIQTRNEREANGRLARLEENLRLVDSGRLTIPEEADVLTFLLSDGRINGPIEPQKRVRVGKLFEVYRGGLPAGALESESLRITAIHMRHIVRTIGAKTDLRAVALDDLQRHVNRRAEEPGRNGQLVSATTIKKELATFRSLWNWASQHGYVQHPFPNRGIRLPKVQEKAAFRTWQEIVREIEEESLSDAEAKERWAGLYLRPEEVASLLSEVKRKSTYAFLHPMVCFAAYTGARRSEICRCRTVDVDLIGQAVVIREKKRTKGRRTYRRIPLAEPLRNVLEDWLEAKPKSEFLFPCDWRCERSRKPREDEGAVAPEEARHHLSRALAKSKWSVITGWHVFRHSFISTCASRGIDQRMIDDWVGHQTDEQRRRYRHLFPDSQAAEIARAFSA